MAGGAGAAGAADAVHVVFRHVGQFEIDHLRQLVDVQTARGDVGGDQHRQRAVLELRQRTRTCGLALVAVDGGRLDAMLGQVLGELVGAVLGAGEHQRLEPLLFLDQVGEQFALLFLANHVDGLIDALGGGVTRRHFHRGRVVQQTLGELADLVGEGGREQQVLALLGQQREHLADVADEAHVEHAVGLVQHQEFDAREVERALADVVEQAPRGGDQDVDTLLERTDLRVDVDAAEHHQRGERQMLAVGLDRFFHLGGEFARRGEDQAARAAGWVWVHVRSGQHVQQRQRETRGLAGAGLRRGEQVATRQHLGNGLGLDGRGVRVARLADGAQDGFCQREAGESHFGIHLIVRREPTAFERHQSGLREEIRAGTTKVMQPQESFQESLRTTGAPQRTGTISASPVISEAFRPVRGDCPRRMACPDRAAPCV